VNVGLWSRGVAGGKRKRHTCTYEYKEGSKAKRYYNNSLRGKGFHAKQCSIQQRVNQCRAAMPHPTVLRLVGQADFTGF